MSVRLRQGRSAAGVPPSRLTHYTNLEGLVGIVDTGQLWASNASFLNDRRELVHGLEASVEAIEKLAAKTYQHWRGVLDEVVHELKNGQIPSTYVLCFCSRNDALSQWRGYGGQEQGVAIVFDRLKLSRLLENAKLMKVVYGTITAGAKVHRALKDEIDDAAAWEFLDDFPGERRRQEAFSILSKMLPRFKHNGFADEREWRYVVQQPEMPDDVCFRAKGNVLVPYLKLGPGNPTKLPISRIIVGPGRDPELTQKSIELFLKKRGYGKVKIQLSNVPFRT